MYIESINTPIGTLAVHADESAILSIQYGMQNGNSNYVTEMCITQLKEYFAGSRKVFDLPLAVVGTQFQKMVWQELVRVPFAETCSYSQIAERIGRPKAQRAVGAANHVNKFPIVIPCHRIIGKGKDLAGYALGLDKKAWLLSHEKITA